MEAQLRAVTTTLAGVATMLDREAAARMGAPAPPDPTAVVSALTNVLKDNDKPREIQGQIVRRADFNHLMPGDEVFNLPIEPKTATDHATISKNESHASRYTDTHRMDPSQGSVSFYDKTLRNNINSTRSSPSPP